MPRYTPPSHEDERLALGSLEFYESGTSTLKTIYSDSSETTPIANPVTLGANGEEPSIFYSGSARVIGKNSAGVQVFDRDPVGGEPELGNFSLWDSNVLYGVNDLIRASNGEYYRSLQASNQDNDPTINPGTNAFWQNIKFIPISNTAVATQPIEIDGSGVAQFDVRPAFNGNTPLDTGNHVDGTDYYSPTSPNIYSTFNGSSSTTLNPAPYRDFSALLGVNQTITLPSGASDGDVVVIHKKETGGTVTINRAGSDVMWLPDGTSTTSNTMPSGSSFSVHMIYRASANRWELSVQG